MMRATVLDLTNPQHAVPWQSNLRWFRVFMFTYIAVRPLLGRDEQLERPADPLFDMMQWGLSAVGALGVIVLLAAITPRLPKLPFPQALALIALLLVAGEIAFRGVFTANHVYLEFIILGLLALLDESDRDEGQLLLNALRWITIIMFFYAGLQKILYGRYFDGQFLAFLTATEDRFAVVFKHLMSAEEFARLRAQAPIRVGAGPYRVDSLVFVIVSNLSYLMEMGCGLLLAWPKTRTIGALVGIAFMIAIEVAAREIVFGLLAVNILLLFLPGDWNRRLFPLFLLAYVYLVAAFFGAVPMFRYHV